jgi:hypothetical protein
VPRVIPRSTVDTSLLAQSADYTAARAVLLDRLDAIAAAIPADTLTQARIELSDRLALLAAGGAGELTAARAALLTNLDAAISTRAASTQVDALEGDTTTLLARLTAGRAGFLDALTAYQNGTVNVSVIHPTQAAPTACTAGAANVMGAYAQIVAAVAGANVLLGIVGSSPVIADTFQVEIAQGAAAAEVVIARVAVRVRSDANNDGGHWIALPYPVQITAGARLAARVSCPQAAAVFNLHVVIMPRPIV